MKSCSRCGVTKEFSEFFVCSKNTTTGRLSRCKECCREVKRLRRLDPRNMAHDRQYYLRRRYGLSIEQAKAVDERNQSGVKAYCAICSTELVFGLFSKGGNAALDHDHTTNVVREYLCNRCNTAIGSMDDSPERLEAAANYIRWHRMGR